MKTFNNNPNLKRELLEELKQHQKIDNFQRDELLINEKYHIDSWYYHLTASIFKNLPEGEYNTFPFDSINILPIGADLNKIKSRYFQIILVNQLRFVNKGSEQEAAMKLCIDLFDKPYDKIKESA